MTGHVFVTHGDLLQLHCDAWLLPSDVMLGITTGFRGDGQSWWTCDLERLRRGERDLPSGWGNDGTRVVALEPQTNAPPTPRPFLVNVGAWEGTPVEWYMTGVRQFCAAVATTPYPRATNRTKPLIALPLVGTGAGGMVTQKGEIVRALLEALYEAAATYDLDFVLVARNAMAHAAIQHARRQLQTHGTGHRTWPELDDRLADLAADLARRARAGHLVLFLGAGVSMGAGLPSWDGLLDALATEAGLDLAQREALRELQPTDRARIIEIRLKGGEVGLRKRIATLLLGEHYSLAHSLLATLPVSEIVTLNYDRLFEFAAEAVGRPVAVLPYQPSMGSARWLLKMHGCIQHPDDIVLTREDYLRYAERRAALAGIVQALLITRHMLFVGFSLTDDNFQRIVDDVRQALGGMEAGEHHTPPHFGTALTLEHKPLLEELWHDSVRPIGMTNGSEAVHSKDIAARRLEILLDRVLAETMQGAMPLLNRHYDELLNEQERAIRALLAGLEGAPERVRQSSAWQPIERLLRDLGATPRA